MMEGFWLMLLVAVSLAVDCFTVSLCIGSSPRPVTPRSLFRVSFHFGLFQGGMTLIGWLLGRSVVSLVSGVDHWIALALLAWVGGRMILEGITHKGEPDPLSCEDRTRGATLILLSVATSIDALGVGLSLALLRVNVAAASLLIALVSLVLSAAGLLGGRRLGRRFGSTAEVVGGLVLVSIGLRIVLTHLAA